jgi:hypothetical protein
MQKRTLSSRKTERRGVGTEDSKLQQCGEVQCVRVIVFDVTMITSHAPTRDVVHYARSQNETLKPKAKIRFQMQLFWLLHAPVMCLSIFRDMKLMPYISRSLEQPLGLFSRQPKDVGQIVKPIYVRRHDVHFLWGMTYLMSPAIRRLTASNSTSALSLAESCFLALIVLTPHHTCKWGRM